MDYNPSSILPSTQPLPRWLAIIMRIASSIYFISGVLQIGIPFFNTFLFGAMGGKDEMLGFFIQYSGIFIVPGVLSLIIGYGLLKHKSWTILFMASSILIPKLIALNTFVSTSVSSPFQAMLSLIPIVFLGLLIYYRDRLEGKIFSNRIIVALLVTVAIQVYVFINATSNL